MDWPDLERRVRDFLARELRVRDALAVDTPLVSAGRVDSVGLVRLAAFVERTTGLRIPDRDVTVAHFDTLEKLRAYVAGRANG